MPQIIHSSHVNATYGDWHSNPSPDRWEALYGVVDAFLRIKNKHTYDALRSRGQDKDFCTDFVVEMMAKIKRDYDNGKRMESPAAFITTAWNRRRISALKALAKEDKRNPTFDPAGKDDEDSGAECAEPTELDKADAATWARGQYHIADDEDEILRSRLDKFGSLAPDVQDLVGLHLRGMKQNAISQELGVSQQKVSRTLQSVKKQFAAPQQQNH